MLSDRLRLLSSQLTFDLQTCPGLIPIVGLNVAGLGFSNYTLKYVDASFYHVAYGLVLPFTVTTSFVVLHARPSLRIILCRALVTAGLFVGVFLDGTELSLVSVGFGVGSSAITATHSVFIKQNLEVVRGNKGRDVLKPLFGVNELVVKEGAMTPFATFVWGSFITGVIAFVMSIASLLSIKVTPPITHMAYLFHDVITNGRASSIAMIKSTIHLEKM